MFPDFPIPSPSEDALGVYTYQSVSGTIKHNYFCTRCGSRLVHKSSAREVVSVKGGCLNLKQLDLSKAVHIWCQEAVVHISEGRERHEQSPPP